MLANQFFKRLMKIKNLRIFILIGALTFGLFWSQTTQALEKKVAIIGSSSFAQFCGSNWEAKLTETVTGYTFTCFAKSGTTAKYFLEQFEANVKDKDYTDVIVYAGLNGLDTISGLAEAQTNLQSLFSQAQAKNIRVIGVTAQPFKGYKTWTEIWGKNIIANNTWLKTKPNGVDVVIDTYALFDQNNDQAADSAYAGSDMLHVNKAGQAALYALIANQGYGLNVPVPQVTDVPGNPMGGFSALGDIGSAYDTTPLSNEELIKFMQLPYPKIRIPGLSFTPLNVEDITTDPDGTKRLSIPFIGEYLAAMYKYLIVIMGIFGVSRLILAGFLWALPSADSAPKEQAKKMITGAVGGIVLAVGSYTILYTVNPNLVTFKNLDLSIVNGDNNLHFVDAGVYKSIVSGEPLSKDQAIALAVSKGADSGISDACLISTIVSIESGGRSNAIGHDENSKANKVVSARKLFLTTGVKYSGETFNKIPETDFDYTVHNKTKIFNDDKEFTNTPPDYGLDWKYGHGFGIAQTTLQPSYHCNGQRGITMNGRCFTIPDLLSPVTNIESMVAHILNDIEVAEKRGFDGTQKVKAVFYSYNAGSGAASSASVEKINSLSYVQKAMALYTKCTGNSNSSGDAQE